MAVKREAAGPGRSGGVKGLPQAARVRPRALDAENDLVPSEEQGNPAPFLFVEGLHDESSSRK